MLFVTCAWIKINCARHINHTVVIFIQKYLKYLLQIIMQDLNENLNQCGACQLILPTVTWPYIQPYGFIIILFCWLDDITKPSSLLNHLGWVSCCTQPVWSSTINADKILSGGNILKTEEIVKIYTWVIDSTRFVNLWMTKWQSILSQPLWSLQ